MAYQPDNVIYLSQLDVPDEELTKQEVESAFQVIYSVWRTTSHVEVPKHLRHLSEKNWEFLIAALDELLDEKESSVVH